MLKGWQSENQYVNFVKNNITTDCPANIILKSKDQREAYTIANDFLRKTVNKSDDSPLSPIIVPLDKSPQVIWWYHGHFLASHLG